MAPFLSSAWLEDLVVTAQHAPRPSGDVSLALQHVVVDGPDGTVRYWLRLEPGGVSAGVGELPDADVVLTTDYDAARALHEGTALAQGLLAAGRLKLAGRVERLGRAREALAVLGDLFAPLRPPSDRAAEP